MEHLGTNWILRYYKSLTDHDLCATFCDRSSSDTASSFLSAPQWDRWLSYHDIRELKSSILEYIASNVTQEVAEQHVKINLHSPVSLPAGQGSPWTMSEQTARRPSTVRPKTDQHSAGDGGKKRRPWREARVSGDTKWLPCRSVFPWTRASKWRRACQIVTVHTLLFRPRHIEVHGSGYEIFTVLRKHLVHLTLWRDLLKINLNFISCPLRHLTLLNSEVFLRDVLILFLYYKNKTEGYYF